MWKWQSLGSLVNLVNHSAVSDKVAQTGTLQAHLVLHPSPDWLLP
jgi:hypothetical protein